MKRIADIIETGVDRLLELIKTKKKIPLSEAAEGLGMPVNIVEEWADFLQEEKIIDIEFRLAKRILMIRGADKKVTDEKKSEFKNKKQQLIRKADATKAFYARETTKINDFKKDLDHIKKEVEKEFGKDSVEFKKLDQYEHMKAAITHDIDKQKAELNNSLQTLDKQLNQEESKFKSLIKQIDFNKSMLSKEKYDEEQIEVKENELKTRLDSLKKLITEVETDLENEKKVHLVVHDMDSFFGKIKVRLEQSKIDKMEKEREKFYSSLQNPSKIKHFDKLIDEANTIIKSKDANKARSKYIDLRAAYAAIANSNADEKIISKCFESLYHTYLNLKHLYSRHSFEDSKYQIHVKSNEATERLDNIKKEYNEIHNKLNSEDKTIYNSKEHMQAFEKMSKKMMTDINHQKQTVLGLLKEAHKLDVKLNESEKKVFKKLFGTTNISSVSKNKEHMRKYRHLFEKKSELEEMIKKINKDKQLLEDELNSLLKKTKAMSIEHSKDPQGLINMLNKMMNEIDVKKKELENEVLMFNKATKEGLQ